MGPLLGNEPQLRKNGVVKLVVAAPEEDGTALLSRLQRRLNARLNMLGNTDFNRQDTSTGVVPLVVVGEALDAFQTGDRGFLFALIADKEGRHQLAPVDNGIKDQIPALAGLRNQSTLDVHTAPCVITESARGLGIPGEVRHLTDDDAIATAISLAMEAQP